MRKAENLKIIWAGSSTQESDEVCEEAIRWVREAIKEISNRLGIAAGKQIRSEAQLPLQGEIANGDFEIPFAHQRGDDKMGLIRQRHYKVYYRIRDIVQSLPLTPDKGGSQTE